MTEIRALRSTPTLIALGSMLALVGVGCGDDEDVVTTDSGTDAMTEDSGNQCANPYVAPTIPTTAACTNAADMTATQRPDYEFVPRGADPTPKTDLDYGEMVAECALECVFEGSATAVETCAQTCIDRSLGSDTAVPSTACRGCYETSALCAAVTSGCAFSCASDAEAPACVSCICGKNTKGPNGASLDCIGDFELCAGVPSGRCDGACLD